MALRIRRGTDAQRSGVVFESGELVWTTDGEQLWIGDGVTAGGKPAVSDKVAGYGLTYNAVSKELEVSGINTDDVTQGVNNKYFTSELAIDAVGAALVAGNATNIGITFTYSATEDAGDRINATVALDGVGIINVVDDTSPQLGGNLDLNSNDITGTGDIDIAGTVTASAGLKGDLYASDDTLVFNASTRGMYANISDADGNILFNADTSEIRLYNSDTAFARFYGNQAGDHTSWLEFYSSNGTFESPTPIVDGDKLSGLILNTWNGTTYDKTVIMGGLADGDVINGQIPGKFVVQNTNASGTGFELLTFDSSGLLSVKSVRVGDGTASNPSIGFTSEGGNDTGIYRAGSGVLCVATNGVERVRVDDDGMRVGGYVKVANVNGTLPASPEEGMIVLDGTIFRGYTSAGWVALNP